MSNQDTRDCPDCGHPNPVGAASCSECNYPLEVGAAAPAPLRREPREPATGPMVIEPPPRLKRLRRKRMASRQSMSLWLIVGALGAASLVYVAIRANVDRIFAPIEGAREQQQERANQLMVALEQDSTDVDARIALADIFYDTGNWPEAIIHYRSAVRLDSSRVTAIVDLGVSYYNLGFVDDAERHFRLALARDPHQTIALFNLGILSERREDHAAALRYFHRALQTDPPDQLRQPIIDALMRVQQKTGVQAPPLPEGQ